MFIQNQSNALTGRFSSPNRQILPGESVDYSFGAYFEGDTLSYDKPTKDIGKDLDLIKEVGFYRYQVIMKMVNQIEMALKKAKTDFPEYQEYLDGIEDIFEDSLPVSVAEAMSRLIEVLEKLPEEIREPFKKKVFEYLEEQKETEDRLIEIKY